MTIEGKKEKLKKFCGDNRCQKCKLHPECERVDYEYFENMCDEEIEKQYKIIFEEEKVNHPNHYNQHSMECIDEMLLLFPKEWVKGFCACNAWKYRERAPYKGTQEEDNKKADWYLNKLKELQEM